MPEDKKKRSIGVKAVVGLICLAVAAAGLFFFFSTFQLKQILVSGSTRYTDEEIRDLCIYGPLSYNTVLLTRLQKQVDLRDVAFLDHADIVYVDKNTVRIEVTETPLAGIFEINDYYYYFDRTGRVTEVFSAPDEIIAERVPYIYGLGASNIGLEHVIEFEYPEALNTIVAIKNAIDRYAICPDSVTFDEERNITLQYDQITVLLGQDKLLEEKISRASAIMPGLEGRTGTLHLETFSQDTENIVFEGTANAGAWINTPDGEGTDEEGSAETGDEPENAEEGGSDSEE